uniref:Uncharacterized protein n=1 Tax=Triticum urartu TaxID=4572 RepID=A0A8R7PU71_TRIUA
SQRLASGPSISSASIHPSNCDANILSDSTSRGWFSDNNGVRADLRAVRDEEQPVPVQGGRPDAGIRGARRGRSGGVAAGCCRVPFPPPQGPPHHGSPGQGRVPSRHRRNPHLIDRSIFVFGGDLSRVFARLRRGCTKYLFVDVK